LPRTADLAAEPTTISAKSVHAVWIVCQKILGPTYGHNTWSFPLSVLRTTSIAQRLGSRSPCCDKCDDPFSDQAGCGVFSISQPKVLQRAFKRCDQHLNIVRRASMVARRRDTQSDAAAVPHDSRRMFRANRKNEAIAITSKTPMTLDIA
jgi:hypothetical protein